MGFDPAIENGARMGIIVRIVSSKLPEASYREVEQVFKGGFDLVSYRTDRIIDIYCVLSDFLINLAMDFAF